MYLPLAPVVALLVLMAQGWNRRLATALCVLLAAALLLATRQRNRIYLSRESIWADTVANRPENARAHNNLGSALTVLPGRLDDAIRECREAVRLDPGFAFAHNNLGAALAKLPGHSEDALAEYEEAVRLQPEFPEAHVNLASALSTVPGRLDEAIAHAAEAVRLLPESGYTRCLGPCAVQAVGHGWGSNPAV